MSKFRNLTVLELPAITGPSKVWGITPKSTAKSSKVTMWSARTKQEELRDDVLNIIYGIKASLPKLKKLYAIVQFRRSKPSYSTH
jgi:hypothetical protein